MDIGIDLTLLTMVTMVLMISMLMVVKMVMLTMVTGDADDGDADARKGNLSCGVASTSLICPLVLLCRKGIC